MAAGAPEARLPPAPSASKQQESESDSEGPFATQMLSFVMDDPDFESEESESQSKRPVSPWPPLTLGVEGLDLGGRRMGGGGRLKQRVMSSLSISWRSSWEALCLAPGSVLRMFSVGGAVLLLTHAQKHRWIRRGASLGFWQGGGSGH